MNCVSDSVFKKAVVGGDILVNYVFKNGCPLLRRDLVSIIITILTVSRIYFESS